MRAARFAERELPGLLEAYLAERRATSALFRSFDAEASVRRGVVSGHPCSVRAQAFIAAGHELHHLAGFGGRYGV